MANKGATVRVLVRKGNLDESLGARDMYPVFQEDTKNIVFEVPEDEAEEAAHRLRGLIDISE